MIGPFLRSSGRELQLLARRAGNRWRPLPAFLVIGTQRGGTTSFFDALSAHPSVAPTFRKEVHFFDEHHARGLGWYRAHFPLQGSAGARRRLAAEATPYYLFHPAVPARVRADLPDVRLVALLRDPVARAISHHQREVRLGREPLSLADAIDAESERLASEAGRFEGEHHRFHSYLARGRYVEQLERWFSVFPRERFLILRSEDFYAEPEKALQACAAFLGLGSWSPEPVKRLQAGGAAGAPDALLERLHAYFEPHNRRLAELLGWGESWKR